MNNYEKLIEYIINEQEDKARELFHQIVVEKSREIYENLIDEEPLVGTDEVDHLIDEIDADQEGMTEADDELEIDAEMPNLDEPGMDNTGMDGMNMDGTDMDGTDDKDELEDRVMDLESALDELKAEFDALMADEESEPEHHDGEEDPEFGGKEPKESLVREYVDKVAHPSNTEGQTVGTGASNKPSVHAKSPGLQKANNMGGTAGNIVKGGSEQAADGKPMPKPNNEYTRGQGQVKHAGSFENVPGAKTKGYAHKSGTKDSEADVNTKSPLAR